jgi:hypothetical protein
LFVTSFFFFGFLIHGFAYLKQPKVINKGGNQLISKPCGTFSPEERNYCFNHCWTYQFWCLILSELLSVGQMMQKGYMLVFGDGLCRIKDPNGTKGPNDTKTIYYH